MMDDPFDLQRFVDALEPVYSKVLEELHHGRKTSHWTWYVSPIVAGKTVVGCRVIRHAICAILI